MWERFIANIILKLEKPPILSSGGTANEKLMIDLLTKVSLANDIQYSPSRRGPAPTLGAPYGGELWNLPLLRDAGRRTAKA